MGVFRGAPDPKTKSFEIGVQGEELTLLSAADLGSFTLVNASSILVTYAATTDDGHRFMMFEPEIDRSDDKVRVFYGTDDRMLGRKVLSSDAAASSASSSTSTASGRRRSSPTASPHRRSGRHASSRRAEPPSPSRPCRGPVPTTAPAPDQASSTPAVMRARPRGSRAPRSSSPGSASTASDGRAATPSGARGEGPSGSPGSRG